MNDEPQDSNHPLPPGKAGGDARSKSLDDARKKEIASEAAKARWEKQRKAIEIRKAQANAPQPEVARVKESRSGILRVGSWVIPCYVLENDLRVITQRSMMEFVGIRSRSSKGGERLVAFMDHPAFTNSDSYRETRLALIEPVRFITPTGLVAFGYTGETLVDYCRLLLRARQTGLFTGETFMEYARQAEMLVASVAKVGIIALIDEATGHQENRVRDDLQRHLDKYLKKEFAAWAKRFPDEFYMEIYRLKGWPWKGMSVNRPQIVARYTNDIIYSRMTPGLLEELEQLNPADIWGNRHHRHHQHFTPDIGHTALQQQIYASMGFMRVNNTWPPFMRMLERAYPRIGDTYALALDDDELNPGGQPGRDDSDDDEGSGAITSQPSPGI